MPREDRTRPEGADPVDVFVQLREHVLAARREVITRQYDAMRPPTEQEVILGAYLEGIEPQVFDAVQVLFAKGYTTVSSGFGFDKPLNKLSPALQFMAFHDRHQFGRDIEERLGLIGVSIREDIMTTPLICFHPLRADLDEMTHKWNGVAALLPDLQHVPWPSDSAMAIYFRTQMCGMETGSPEEVAALYPDLYPTT